MQLKVENLNYIYAPGTAFEEEALKNINFEINAGEFVGLIGHTGSGKSTLVQHLNGLIKMTSGRILYNDEDIYAKGYNMKNLRQKIGLVFQYPEYQLFESDVLSDVKYGPKNQGMSDEEAESRAKEALIKVGVSDEYWTMSPFDLSGGQKRRVAIAGTLAMNPELLILDEPTAGLDPQGRNEILDCITKLHEETKTTVLLVSHSMDDVARYVDRVLVIDKGRLVGDAPVRELFNDRKKLEKIGLAAPQVMYIAEELNSKGFKVRTDAVTLDELADSIEKCLETSR